MVTGKVKWFSDAKGYGFIQREAESTDVFVHFTQIQVPGYRTLYEGQMVQFEMNAGDKGPQANNVVPQT